MKWMEKIRLINWHYYNDETIVLGKQTVISGHTGAGKSTIIDALQVLFIADERKIKFNSAAHDDAKRSLINYLRGKIGSKEKSFVRSGAFTSTIIAEFNDDQTNEKFVVGCCIDVYKDDEKVKAYFILPKTEIDRLKIFYEKNGKRFVHRQDDFCDWIKQNIPGAIIEKNQEKYHKALLHRFGGLHERFLKTFSKALSFKPIDNIRDFVYDNILEKKELKIDVMKNIFQSHEDLQTELQDLKVRKEKLEQINIKFLECVKLKDTISIQEYVIRGIDYLLSEEKKSIIKGNIELKEKELKKFNSAKEKSGKWKEIARKKSIEIQISINNNNQKINKDELENKIAENKKNLLQHKQLFQVYIHSLRREENTVNDLIKFKNNEYYSVNVNVMQELEKGANCLSYLIENKGDGGLEEKEILINLGNTLQLIGRQFTESKTKAKIVYKSLKEEEQKLISEIKNLENGRRLYNPSVNHLKNLLEQYIGKESKIRIFCEEMEVKNERWRNALEGYLNTQRFDILVDPHVFSKALSIYEAEKWKYKLEGVGLVDTEKEKGYLGKLMKGSLADELECDDPIVMARIHHLLGNVMKADNEQDLRKYNTAITPSCMSYSRLAARQIPKRFYETPFIGNFAIERQIEIKQEALLKVQTEIAVLSNFIESFQVWIEKLEGKNSIFEKYLSNLSLNKEIQRLNKMLEDWIKELNSLDLSQLEELLSLFEKTEKKYNFFNDREVSFAKQVGKLGEEINTLKTTLLITKNEGTVLKEKWESWKSENNIELFLDANKRFESVVSEKKPYATVKTNFQGNKKGNESKYADKWDELVEARKKYNNEHTFDGSVSVQDNIQYQDALSKISNVDIPKFEESIKDALAQAEEEFQSHFVFKMREAIQAAQREFRTLNHALSKFPFRDDKYRFEIRPNEPYKKFFEVIMDETLQSETSLFDYGEDDKSAILSELFTRLVKGEYGEQDEFIDYRHYLDFDLIINNEHGTTHMSELLLEQSGGETQTPFYIAILASFQQLYHNKNSVRLVVFDEAFNKMDEERIQISLRLIKQLNLQLIAAVPDEKMAHMAPEVETTIIINRIGHVCFSDMISNSGKEESVELQEQDSFVFTE